LSETPALSVVVAASDSAEAAARAVASIRDAADDRIEVIVSAARDRLDPRECPPGSRRVVAEAGTGVPGLRRLGFDASRARVVAFTEDSCAFGPGWAASWRLAFADPRTLAATGPVIPAMGDAALDWAVFFCEYAPFLPSRRGVDVPPSRLAGNNFAVRREVVEALDLPEIQECEVFRAAAERDPGAIVAAAARAWHVRRYEPAEAIGDRLWFGREYGRLRAACLPAIMQPLGLLVGPAILLIQAARLSRTVATRRDYLGRYFESLPITLALLSAWSVGEWIGWLEALVRRPVGKRCGTEGQTPAPAPGPDGSRRPHCRPAPPAA
jgi:hypothetical protein